jgi:hypothetical protein
MDGIFLAMLQEERRVLYLTWSESSMPACLLATFQPCGDRLRYCLYLSPAEIPIVDLRILDLSVSHRSFLRTERYLREEILAPLPLHPNQHAYQAVKSVEMALHQLVVQVEKVLDQQERTLGVFLDIKGAFSNTCYDSMCDALVKQGCDNTTVQWIRATLEGHVFAAILNVSSIRVAISTWCQ